MEQQLVTKDQVYNLLRNDDTLKSMIRDIVQNDNFWESYYKRILKNQELEQKINYIVGQQMDNVSSEMKRKVSAAKTELQNLKEQARKDLSTEILLNLPNQVATQIAQQMPAFLNDSKIMQKILDDHINRLTEQLEEVARQHLNKIVDEEQYHTVNQRYFEAFDQKGQEVINSHTFKVDQQLQTCRTQSDQLLQTCRTQSDQLHEQLTRKYDTDMGGLKTGLNQLGQINTRITSLQSDLRILKREKKELETNFSHFKIGVGLIGTTIAAVGLASYLR